MMLLIKAKAYPVGTIRKRKDGYFKKIGMHEWVPVKDTGHAGKYRAWHDRMTTAFENLPTILERDAWVGAEFKKYRKNVYPVLKTARSIVGYDVAPETVTDQGFRGLCAAIITKLYNQGPRGLDKAQLALWQRVFRKFFQETGEKPNLVPLHKALTKVNENSFFTKNPRWFIYCATRMAGKNGGMVNMNGVEQYMRNAMRKHKGKNPPAVDYDDPGGRILAHIRMGLISPKTAAKKLKKALLQIGGRVNSLVGGENVPQLDYGTAKPPVDGGSATQFSKGHKRKKIKAKFKKRRKL